MTEPKLSDSLINLSRALDRLREALAVPSDQPLAVDGAIKVRYTTSAACSIVSRPYWVVALTRTVGRGCQRMTNAQLYLHRS